MPLSYVNPSNVRRLRKQFYTIIRFILKRSDLRGKFYVLQSILGLKRNSLNTLKVTTAGVT